jgi:Xaa-Pro aminopeptidase
VVLLNDGTIIVYEQGDNWMHTQRMCPWLDKVKYSYATWIKGVAGVAAIDQALKFFNDLKAEMKDHGVADLPIAVDFVDNILLSAAQKVKIELVDGLSLMNEVRSVKTRDEIEALKVSASIGDYLHSEVTRILRPGITENRVVAELSKLAYSIPYVDDFTPLVTSGPLSWPNYRSFTDRMIDYGDLVLVDIMISWNGYRTCYYRTYCVGKQPTQEQKDYYQMALDWENAAISKIRPGITTKEIAEVWPEATKLWGYREEEEAAANLWGHGIGLALYDLPLISRINSIKYPYPVKEDMTFAIETQHGKNFQWGVRIERMVVVTSTGHEILDKIPVDEIIVVR